MIDLPRQVLMGKNEIDRKDKSIDKTQQGNRRGPKLSTFLKASQQTQFQRDWKAKPI